MKNVFIIALLFSIPICTMEISHYYDIESPSVIVKNTLTIQEENRICGLLLERYLFAYDNVSPRVEPFIRRRLRTLYDSQQHEHIFNSSDMDKRELHDLILHATTEALKKEAEEREEMWSKKKTACAAGLTGLISTALTSAVALIIHFTTQNQCDA